LQLLQLVQASPIRPASSTSEAASGLRNPGALSSKIRKIRQAIRFRLILYFAGEVNLMIAWKRAIALGFASWAIPFALSFLVFPLKKSNAPLFETMMALIELITAGALFQRHFRGRAVSARESVPVGVLWLAVNLVMDYPMFAFGPMKMPVSTYYSEIGLIYLMFPVFGFWAARLAQP
jgi:hypothetical protein